LFSWRAAAIMAQAHESPPALLLAVVLASLMVVLGVPESGR
jgi:hypothetical protein